MAKIVMRQARILGFAARAGAAGLHAAMSAVRGPDLYMLYGPAVVALFQGEPDLPLAGDDPGEATAGLLSVQRRLEAGCAAGSFLPMDPAAACCPYGDVGPLLDATGAQLAETLRRQGDRRQWDISLRWPSNVVAARHQSEIVPAASLRAPGISPAASLGAPIFAEAAGSVPPAERNRRAAALLAALRPAVLAFAEGGAAATGCQVAVTVLMATNAGAAAIEAALDGLATEYAEGCGIDIRGPLPPLSFPAVRLAMTDADAVTHAWSTLGLGNRVDLAALHRCWRQGAVAAPPGRQPDIPITGATVAELTTAYRLLRDLLANDGPFTMADLLSRCGTRLVMPADPVDQVAATRVASEPELAGLS
jgi:hypothetical protein